MRRGVSVLVSVLTVSLTACGLDASGEGGDDDNTNLLAGSWKTTCFAEIDESGNPSGYSRRELKVSGSDFVTMSYFFKETDTSCSAARYSKIVTATFSVGSTVSDIPGAKAINYLPTKTEVTPATAEHATIFSADPYCGISDWQAGVKRDVTGKPCEVPREMFYDVYRLQGASLVFGYADGAEVGSTPDLRPKTLDLVHGYERA